MLQLGLAPASEVLHVAIRSKPSGIPQTDRVLDAKLILEGPQRGSCVQRPIAPSAPGETILEEHPDDRHHRQAAIRDLSAQFPLQCRGIG